MIKLLPEVQGLVLNGDCLNVLKELEDNSVDSIITDPPYELGFMGKSWDNTGIANNKEMWKECLRVLKPGAYLLSFGGTRTYHRMACAIEDAGFEVRDMIEWVYGSGFPKSLNIGKAVDKLQGNEREEFEYEHPQRKNRSANYTVGFSNSEDRKNEGGSKIMATKGTSDWEGWGTALKPAHEPIVMARKPLAEKTVAENVLKYGTGGINIDESRVGTEERTYALTMTSGNFETTNGGKNIKSGESTVQGRFPANLIWSHHPDCKRIGFKEVSCNSHYPEMNVTGYGKNYGGKTEYIAEGERPKSEQVESWECVDGCPSKEFEKAGISKGNGSIGGGDGGIWTTGNRKQVSPGFSDSGTPARFFKTCEFTEEDFEYSPFFYCAKASKSERNDGCEELEEKRGGCMEANVTDKMQLGGASLKGEPKEIQPTKNNHPTVKPLNLMEYLIKMVTPKGGVVLDPFAGSGTTLVASKKLGYKYIGIELTKEYLPIIEARLENVKVGVVE